jgi:signal transduction histidine kinase
MFLIIAMLTQVAISESIHWKQVFILSSGVILSITVDLYCVLLNSPLRWLMLSTGAFAMSEAAIWYVSRKQGLFGILAVAPGVPKEADGKILERLEFQKRLLSLLTHDLSGNIHSQAKLLQLLRQKPQDGQNEILNTLSDSASASQDLLHNIMRWIKTQDGQIRPKIEVLEIRALLEDCIHTVKGALPQRKVEVRIEMPESPCVVHGDALMLGSILRNLISNAIQSTSDGKKILIQINKQGSRMQFAVIDEGVGMTPEQMKSLGTENVQRSHAGYGIGLTLVRYFVELHQGTLQIESVPGQGTQVYFSIPL